MIEAEHFNNRFKMFCRSVSFMTLKTRILFIVIHRNPADHGTEQQPGICNLYKSAKIEFKECQHIAELLNNILVELSLAFALVTGYVRCRYNSLKIDSMIICIKYFKQRHGTTSGGITC